MTGDKKQIELAREMIKEVMDQVCYHDYLLKITICAILPYAVA